MSEFSISVLRAERGGASVDYAGRLSVEAFGGDVSAILHGPTDEQVAEALAAGGILRYVTSDTNAAGFFYTIDMSVLGLRIVVFPDTEQLWAVASGSESGQPVAA